MQVYENLQPQAFFLKLAGNGAGLASAWEAITRLEAAISVLNVYYAINGICILLLIARWVATAGCFTWQAVPQTADYLLCSLRCGCMG